MKEELCHQRQSSIFWGEEEHYRFSVFISSVTIGYFLCVTYCARDRAYLSIIASGHFQFRNRLEVKLEGWIGQSFNAEGLESYRKFLNRVTASEIHSRELNSVAVMENVLQVRGDRGKSTIPGFKLWRFGNSWLQWEGDIVKV